MSKLIKETKYRGLIIKTLLTPNKEYHVSDVGEDGFTCFHGTLMWRSGISDEKSINKSIERCKLEIDKVLNKPINSIEDLWSVINESGIECKAIQEEYRVNKPLMVLLFNKFINND